MQAERRNQAKAFVCAISGAHTQNLEWASNPCRRRRLCIVHYEDGSNSQGLHPDSVGRLRRSAGVLRAWSLGDPCLSNPSKVRLSASRTFDWSACTSIRFPFLRLVLHGQEACGRAGLDICDLLESGEEDLS